MNMAQALRIPPRIALVALALTGWALASGASDARADGEIVISQVYGGGGNTGADLTNDFIELFNRGVAPVSITGWSVQYSAAFGSTWASTTLSGTIPAGGYYLVEEGTGGFGSTPLPTPDATGGINLSATAGKCALVNNATLLSGACPVSQSIVDMVGYGSSANCYEGLQPAVAPNILNSIQRDSAGCQDTDDNYSDFFETVATPRNASWPLNGCHPVPVTPRTWGNMKSMYR